MAGLVGSKWAEQELNSTPTCSMLGMDGTAGPEPWLTLAVAKGEEVKGRDVSGGLQVNLCRLAAQAEGGRDAQSAHCPHQARHTSGTQTDSRCSRAQRGTWSMEKIVNVEMKADSEPRVLI